MGLLFDATTQPSVKRGALLLALLIFFNLLTAGAILLLGKTYPALSGLALLAWGFGFRHAMDADHIAAIDNVTRRLLYRGKHSVGVGFFFSLGHSTIVLALTIIILFFTPIASAHMASWKELGTTVGMAISALFLLVISIVNTGVLLKLFDALRNVRLGKENTYHGHMHIGGPIEKLFRPLLKLVDHSYKMYFIGFLFGLGFDTATEVGLLAISALAVTNTPPIFVLLLPLAFMAGMTLLDTVNSLLMLGIYTWGAIDEKRRIIYNINITCLSLLSAIVIGLTLLLRVIGEHFAFQGTLFSLAQKISFDNAGYYLFGFFALSWIIALWGLRPKKEESLSVLS